VLVVEADGGWSRRYVVDIAYAEFAPVISIEEPQGVEKDERITATIGCDAPFDIDDDSSDDTASTFHRPSSVLAVSSSDVAFIAGTAAAIVLVAWVAGAIRPQTTTGGKESGEGDDDQAQDSPVKSPEPLPTTDTEPTNDEADDDISIVVDDVDVEHDPSSSNEAEARSDLKAPSEEEGTTALVEHIPTQDTSPSGRLASIREEMGADDQNSAPTESIEDRMSRFFGGGR